SNTLVCRSWAPGNYSWSFETSGTGGEFAFKSSVTGTAWDVQVVSSGAALTTGIWHHLAVDKDSSGKIRIYKNGVPMGSATPVNSSMKLTNNALTIVSDPWCGYTLNGFIDELRITKGIARYKTDAGFSPPTHAFPREGPP